MYLVKLEIYIYKMPKNDIHYLTRMLFFILSMSAIFSANSAAQPPTKNKFATSPLIKCWETESNGIAGFASDNLYVFLSHTNGDISLLKSLDHSQIWINSLGNKLISDPFIINGNYFVLSRNTSPTEIPRTLYIRKINNLTGLTDWINEINIEDEYQIVTNNKLNKLIIISKKLDIFSFNLNTGKSIWQKIIKGNLNKISAVNDDYFSILTTESNFLDINYSDGNIIRNKIFSKEKLTTFTSSKDLVIAGNKLGIVYSLQNSYKLPKKLFRTGGEIIYIGLTDKNFYVVSNDNFLYLYSLERRKLIWKKRLPGRVIIKPTVEENIIIISTIAAPELYFFGIEAEILINKIELTSDYIIKDIQQNQREIFIQTNNGLNKFAEHCSN